MRTFQFLESNGVIFKMNTSYLEFQSRFRNLISEKLSSNRCEILAVVVVILVAVVITVITIGTIIIIISVGDLNLPSLLDSIEYQEVTVIAQFLGFAGL